MRTAVIVFVVLAFLFTYFVRGDQRFEPQWWFELACLELILVWAFWHTTIDLRYGPGWVALHRHNRWRAVDLTKLESARLGRPPFFARRGGSGTWWIDLRDSNGGRVKLPAFALDSDARFTPELNVALAAADLPSVQELFQRRRI
jgi:hypothetical protein